MTVTNLRILEENVLDQATLVVTPGAEADMPAENMQTVKREEICRVIGTLMTIDIELDRGRLMQALILSRHNFSSGATWKREMWTGPNRTGTKVYDSDTDLIEAPVPLGEFVLGLNPLAYNRYTEWATAYAVDWLAALLGVTSIRITISDENNPDGYLQVSRLLGGTYRQPLVNMNWGHKLQWVDSSAQERSDGDSLISESRSTHRRVEFQNDWISEGAERAALMEIARKLGKSKDTFISLYPGDADTTRERDYMMNCKLEETPTSSPPFLGFQQQTFTFVEC